MLHAVVGIFGCTTLVVTPPATRDGEIYLLWNFDLLRPGRVIFDRFRFFIAGGDGYRYAAWGIPSVLHIGMMNEKGLCFVGNAVGMTDGGLDGTTTWELVDNALSSCSTVEDVIKLYGSTKRLIVPGYSAAIFMNLNSMWADAAGDAVTIECSRNHMAVHHIGEEGIMVETNHHQYLHRELSGGSDPEKQKMISGSYARLGRAWKLARRYKGSFDLKTVMRFASDHGTDYGLLSSFKYELPETGIVDDSTICCHLWNVPFYLRKNQLRKAFRAVVAGETLYSFILQPKRRLIWFCRGKPCTSKYVPLDFGKAFRKAKKSKPVLLRINMPELLARVLRFADRMLPIG